MHPAPVSMTQGRVVQSLYRIMEKTQLCSLATVGPNGRAHICHVYFAYSPSLQLYFLSDPQSRHCKNLAVNSSVAVSVFDSTQRWGGRDAGIALYGLCQQLGKAEADEAARVYARRFHAYSKWRVSIKEGDEAEGWRFYRFSTRRVKVFDETSLGAGVFAVASVRKRLAHRNPPPS